MKRSLRRIQAFGLSTYLSKKLYDVSPILHRVTFGRARTGFVQTAYGVEMGANWEDATFRMCVFGGHGEGLSTLLAGTKTPFAFFDVGANQGLFSLIAVKNPNCVSAIAFEPVPDTFDILLENAKRSAESDRIQCVKAAIAAEAGTAEINLKSGHSGGASLADHSAEEGQTVSIDTMSARQVDELVPADAALIIKIDVEGFEGVVVPELMKLHAADRISHVFCEIDLEWVDEDAITSALSAVGLTKQRRIGGRRHFDLLAERP